MLVVLPKVKNKSKSPRQESKLTSVDACRVHLSAELVGFRSYVFLLCELVNVNVIHCDYAAVDGNENEMHL